MAPVIHWYDLLCFAVVAGTIICSAIIIYDGEFGGHRRDAAAGRHSRKTLLGRNGGVGYPARRASRVAWDELWTSCWPGVVRPKFLLLTRLLSFAAMVSVLAWDIRTFGWKDFVYYTPWTITLVTMYFGIATFVSTYGCWNYSNPTSTESDSFVKWYIEENCPVKLTRNNEGSKNCQSYSNEEVNSRRAGFCGYLMQIVYQTSAGAVFLTDAVFWGFTAPSLQNVHFKLNWVMSCTHSLNAVLLILDTVLNNLTFPWFRIAYFLLWSCIYIIFQWVLHACGFSWWPYPFLLLSSPWAPLW